MSVSIIRLPEVKRRTGLSTSTIYRMMRDGKFAKPVRIGLRSVGWVESDVEAWIAGCLAEHKAFSTMELI